MTCLLILRPQIVKLLGEGGFSFVYLAEDETSGRLFALKKVRQQCLDYWRR